jgi:hypothetical protein
MTRRILLAAFATVSAIASATFAPSVSIAQPVCTYTTTYQCGEDSYGCQCISGTSWESCSNPPPYTCGDCSLSGQFCNI